jgi:hypothetical protein
MSVKKKSRTAELTSAIFGRRIIGKTITRWIISRKVTLRN